MKRIPLTQGKFALVDDEDYVWLNQWKWSIVGGKNGIGKDHKVWYALRRKRIDKKDVSIYMH